MTVVMFLLDSILLLLSSSSSSASWMSGVSGYGEGDMGGRGSGGG